MQPYISGKRIGTIIMTYYTTIDTPFCKIIITGNKNGISGLHLDTGEGKREFTIADDWIQNDSIFIEARKQIIAYCEGKLTKFNLPLQLHGTEFQKKVWTTLSEIPFGEVRTYGEIAQSIGNRNSSRAVGMANSKNPIPLIIPCHRVIGANGSLTGFAHGLTIKEQLLEFENPNK